MEYPNCLHQKKKKKKNVLNFHLKVLTKRADLSAICKRHITTVYPIYENTRTITGPPVSRYYLDGGSFSAQYRSRHCIVCGADISVSFALWFPWRQGPYIYVCFGPFYNPHHLSLDYYVFIVTRFFFVCWLFCLFCPCCVCAKSCLRVTVHS